MNAVRSLLMCILCIAAPAASAATVEISDDHGGLLMSYQLEWATLAAQGVKVRIVGPCVSACTVLLGYIPNNDICVTPNAAFGFHWATVSFATQELWRAYPANIRGWIYQHGGLTSQLIWLQTPEIYRYFRKC